MTQILSAQAPNQSPQELPPSPFKEPQKRSKRIRYNNGAWNPIVDLTEIFPGNRNVDERGVCRLYDGAVGVKLRVEQAERSEPLLEAVAPWERGSGISPLLIWNADGLWHMLYEISAADKTGYATSEDAFHWERPVMGQVGFGGSTENNLLANGIRGATGAYVDGYAPPDERFKAMGGDMAWYDPATLQWLHGKEAWGR